MAQPKVSSYHRDQHCTDDLVTNKKALDTHLGSFKPARLSNGEPSNLESIDSGFTPQRTVSAGLVVEPPTNKKPGKPSGKRKYGTPASKRLTHRKGKAKAKATAAIDNTSWKAQDRSGSKTWDFRADTTFVVFCNVIGIEPGEIWWYQGVGMADGAPVSTEGEYKKLLRVALSGKQKGQEPLQLWKSSNEDWESPS
jgi:hypothetical protein